MNNTNFSYYKIKFWRLDRTLKQTIFILLAQKLDLVEYIFIMKRIKFAKTKSSIVISVCQIKRALYVRDVQSTERTPIFYQNKEEFVDQVTCFIYSGSIKAPYKSDNCNQHIMREADYDGLRLISADALPK